MFKQYRANYSLRPEYARPRWGNSLKFVAGSFVFGVVCAAAAYGAVFNFGAPTNAPLNVPTIVIWSFTGVATAFAWYWLMGLWLKSQAK